MKYFFDFRSGGQLFRDEEGLELPDADKAHQEAQSSLLDAIRDTFMEGASYHQFAIEVRDDLGQVFELTAVLASRILRKQ